MDTKIIQLVHRHIYITGVLTLSQAATWLTQSCTNQGNITRLCVCVCVYTFTISAQLCFWNSCWSSPCMKWCNPDQLFLIFHEIYSLADTQITYIMLQDLQTKYFRLSTISCAWLKSPSWLDHASVPIRRPCSFTKLCHFFDYKLFVLERRK